MSRQPRTDAELLAWHTAALAGLAPPTHDGDPQCGWYSMTDVKRGPLIPVVIWCDREIDEAGELMWPERLRADVWGEEADPGAIWTYLDPITQERHAELTAWRQSNQHALNSKRPIDLGRTPTPPRG